MSSILQDLVFALRTLRKNPGFAAVALTSLALGIGANTAVFSTFDAILLRPLPVHAPDELVLLHWTADSWEHLDISIHGWVDSDGGRLEGSSFSYPFFERLRESDTELADVLAFARLRSLNLRAGDVSLLGDGHLVSGGYFESLGVRALRGRLIQASDDAPDAGAAVVLSYPYWRSRFDSADDVVGSELRINGAVAVVVGVAPPGFLGVGQAGFEPDVFLPFSLHPLISDRGDVRSVGDRFWVHILGRRDGATALDRVADSLQAVFREATVAGVPGLSAEDAPRVLALDGSQGMTEQREDLRFAGQLTGTAVALILVIACLNLANLLLARSQARRREIAVRRSLGAGRLRIVQQLLTETVVMASIGGAAGLLVARWIQGAVVGEARTTGLEISATLDGRALVFTLGVSILTGLLFGLGPAIRCSRGDVQATLQSAPVAGRSSGRLRISSGLLALQVALSLVILVAAALLVRTIQNLYRADTGYRAEQVLLFGVDPSLNHYEAAEALRLLREIERGIAGQPGVVAVAYSDLVPAGGTISTEGLAIPDSAAGVEGQDSTILNAVSPGFFETYSVPILRGRAPTDEDTAGGQRIAVVNEAFVRRHFPDGDALGRRFGASTEGPFDVEIVGVVGDFAYVSPRFGVRPSAHVALAQQPSGIGGLTFAVRHRGPAADLADAVRRVVRGADPSLPVFDVRTQREQLDASLVRERIFASVSAGLGLAALALACIGLYGLLSYSVLRRTHEIGIRMALGARGGHIFRLVGSELAPVLVGLLLGLLGAWFATDALGSLLYGLAPMDPLAVASAVAVLLVVAVLAGSLPARRAVSVEPVEALRIE